MRLQRLRFLPILIAVLSIAIGSSSSISAQSVNPANAVFSVNLASGAFSFVGCVGLRDRVVGLATTNSIGYALLSGNKLTQFPLNNPNAVSGTVAITGAGQSLIGIDIRPLTGVLYGLGNGGTIYTIDPATGVATALAGGPVGLDGRDFGFDFNPQADRIRIVSNRTQNLRLLPADGSLAANDKKLAYAGTDVNAGRVPNVEGAAYTNNVANAASTQLFVIDTSAGVLALQSPPNDGVLTSIGSVGVQIGNVAGFDITPGGAAYAVGRAGGVAC